MARQRSAWRGLGLFWLILLLAAAAGGATLQALGPLPHPPIPATAEAVHAPPEPAPVHEAETVPAPPPGVARPDAALLERSRSAPQLMLPRVAADGRTARSLYAAPVPPVPAGAKRVALLVGSFGASDKDSRAALDSLPGTVSLGVSSYVGSGASALLDAARAAGHELLAAIPMEPDGYPLNDEGTRSLRTGRTPEENRTNLEWALGQTQGAVGATGASDGMRGERFAGLAAVFDPVVEEIVRRGLLYVDPRPGVPTAAGQPVRSVDVVLDDSQARAEIEARLAALERVAREKGSAIGLAGQPRPVTLERIAAWAQGLSARGLVLVPVSSLIETPR